MLETALAQVRFAASVLLGVPFNVSSFEGVVRSLLETRREFGSITPEGAEALSGPALDEETRQEMHLRRFRKQAVRAARETPYSGDLFRRLGTDPARMSREDIAAFPLTTKDALKADPDAFVCRSATPTLRAVTTGTTGRPPASASPTTS